MNVQITAIDIDKRVEQYIRLRDKIQEIEEKHSEELKPYKEAKEQLESMFLDHLNNTGADKIGSKSGTVYRSEKKSASIKDKSAFWAYVVTQGLFDLLDYKANPTQVAEHIKNHGSPPPGVNFTTRHTVNVRRA